MCPICQNATGPNDVTLNCGGQHVLHLACLQELANHLAGPVATDDEGPRGSQINYLDLPACPLCRGRILLGPNVVDPFGRDNFVNNNPEAPPYRYYYDTTQGLTQAEVQTHVIDPAQQALDDVNDLSDGEMSDDGGHESEGEEMSEDEEQDGEPTSLGYRLCPQCHQQAEFIVYPSAHQYRDEHPDDDFVPCPDCDNDVEADDQNVTACMGCWAAWHDGCRHP